MRQLAVVVLSLVLCSAVLRAERSDSAAPPTARQALLEMFFSKQPGTFLRHLPAVTRATLEQSGALAGVQQYSAFAGQLQTQGKSFQTFESGPLLLSAEDIKTGQKFEVMVDKDAVHGDKDDIELSFHTYKDGQAQRTPFMPRIVFSMKMEAGVWTLHDIAITINLPLADPDLLNRISDGMKARAAASTSISPQIRVQGTSQGIGQGTMQVQLPPQIQEHSQAGNFGGDAGALSALRKILAAETTYAATYPAVGYTCKLSDLDGFGASEANEHQAMLISSSLASGKHLEYSFVLSGCGGTRSSSFRLTAAPIGQNYGRRAFCSDQSGEIRSSGDGVAATCQKSGTPVP
jgi:hypothetical protein